MEGKFKYLSRPEAAQYLTDMGMITSKGTLQKLACIGGGPTYRRFGKRAVYTAEDLDCWIASRLSAPIASAIKE